MAADHQFIGNLTFLHPNGLEETLLLHTFDQYLNYVLLIERKKPFEYHIEPHVNMFLHRGRSPNPIYVLKHAILPVQLVSKNLFRTTQGNFHNYFMYCIV